MKTVLFVGKAKNCAKEITYNIDHLKSEGVKTFGDLLVYLNFHKGLMAGLYDFKDLRLTPYGCFILKGGEGSASN